MKAILACVSAALLASSAIAAEPWQLTPAGAVRNTSAATCVVWASRTKLGWFGQINATTPRYSLIMHITDGSDGRDIINTADVYPVPRHSWYLMYVSASRPLVRGILAEACPLGNLTGPAAEVLKIANGY